MKEFLYRMGMVIGMAALIFLFVAGLDGIAAFQSPVDLYDEDTDYNEVSHFAQIDTEFDVSLGCFVEEENTTTRKGAVTSRRYYYYYAVPVYSGEDTYWIGIRVSESDARTWEKITDNTYDYLMGNTDYFGQTTSRHQGRIKKMGDQEYRYMKEMFQEMGWFADDSQVQKYVLPYYVDPFIPSVCRYMFLFGIGGTLLGGFCAFRYFFGNRNSKEKKKAQAGKTTVNIAGLEYPRELFVNVDRYVNQKENVFAIQELRQITGIGLEEAKSAIDQWQKIYH